MKLADVKIGSRYRARVSGKLTVVEVTALVDERQDGIAWGGGRSSSIRTGRPRRFRVVNLNTGRQTSMTAAKLRVQVVGPCKPGCAGHVVTGTPPADNPHS